MAQPHLPNAASSVAADQIVVLRNVTWADYQHQLELRGERPVPRVAYLEGTLELMTPSRSHEVIKSMIGRLVEAWCLEMDVAITPYGSWLLESEAAARALEPDECYVFGDDPEPACCDLAIEVIWTSGSINKLEIYRKLGVREVWIWKAGKLAVFALRDGHYARSERSERLPAIDLDEIVRYIDVKPMTRAVKAYRAALSARK
jgi:Uma2 family endonuclease